MLLPYSLIEQIVFFEIILAVAVVVATYCVRSCYLLKKLIISSTSRKIHQYFSKTLASNSNIDTCFLRKSWQKLDILLPIIRDFDQTQTSAQWLDLRAKVLAFLLPTTQDQVLHGSWFNRLLVAQLFELGCEQDQTLLLNLLDDGMPLVKFHATLAAIKGKDKVLFNKVIDNISKERRLSQSMYLKAFEAPHPETRVYIEERLKTEQDPNIRTVCYKIYLDYSPPAAPSSLASLQDDLNSHYIELRLASMRYAAYARTENITSYFLECLQNEQWTIRAVAIKLLADLKAIQHITKIADCLHDPIWWVRINAAQGLQQLGPKGAQVLQSQNPETNFFAYEAAMHVLKAPLVSIASNPIN